ncbi:MAG: HAMP domain-containing sensor histidine kinase [Actinomycetota bacterium]|nr:HAMP domain-containing sensor histidine kinase [Actinomycetota bacterium]
MKKLTIKTRITLWYALLLLFILVIFNVFIYMVTSRILMKNNEDLLLEDTRQVFSIIQSEGYLLRFETPYKIIATNSYFVIFDSSGKTSLASEIQPEIISLPIEKEQVRYVSVNNIRWVVADTAIKIDDKTVGWVRVSRSLEFTMSLLKNLKIIIFVSIPFYILLASFGGFFLASRALRPIDRITKIAKEISKGDLSRRIKMKNSNDEVGRLADTFDEMLDKLESSIKKERQFASDASHELRTPIAVINAQVEQALSSKRKVDEYREALNTVGNEGRKMNHIISQLIMIYRSEEGRYKFNFESIELNEIISDIVEEFKTIADTKKIKINFKPNNNIMIKADQTLITRLFINLIENAIKYTGENGEISINTGKDDKNANVIIDDTGIGIAQKDMPYIFDRFYQAESSRSENGTGLGLSIVKWIINIHKGFIDVKSNVNKGTTFIIKLPIDM